MAELERISFTIERPLLERLEALRAARGYETRSELIRDLIRDRVVEDSWDRGEDEERVGTVTMIYDHHKKQLGEKLADLQHDHHEEVLATTHVHLDRHTCAEVVLTRGSAKRLRALANAMLSQKGVLHGEFTMTSGGKDLR